MRILAGRFDLVAGQGSGDGFPSGGDIAPEIRREVGVSQVALLVGANGEIFVPLWHSIIVEWLRGKGEDGFGLARSKARLAEMVPRPLWHQAQLLQSQGHGFQRRGVTPVDQNARAQLGRVTRRPVVRRRFIARLALPVLRSMADAPDSKSGPRKGVWVQVPPSGRTFCIGHGVGLRR